MKPTREEMIDFLKRDQYSNSGITEIRSWYEEFSPYIATLENTPDTELEELYSKRLALIQQEATEKVSNSFYNQLIADDKLDYYCKRTRWTVEETAALILERDPIRVNCQELRRYGRNLQVSGFLPRSLDVLLQEAVENFKQKFVSIQSLIDEAIKYKELPYDLSYDNSRSIEVMSPIKLIQWAKAKEMPLPIKLEQLVTKYNTSGTYTNTETDNQKLKEEICSLKEENDKLRKQLDAKTDLREVNTIRKLVLQLLALVYNTAESINGSNINKRLLDNEEKIYNTLLKLLELKSFNIALKELQLDIPTHETISDIIQKSLALFYNKSKPIKNQPSLKK